MHPPEALRMTSNIREKSKPLQTRRRSSKSVEIRLHQNSHPFTSLSP
jgi:hypothetical protein